MKPKHYIQILFLILYILILSLNIYGYTGRGFVSFDIFNYTDSVQNHEWRGSDDDDAVPHPDGYMNLTGGGFRGLYGGSDGSVTNSRLTNISYSADYDVITEFSFLTNGVFRFVSNHDGSSPLWAVTGNGWPPSSPEGTINIEVPTGLGATYHRCDKVINNNIWYNMKIIYQSADNTTDFYINNNLLNCSGVNNSGTDWTTIFRPDFTTSTGLSSHYLYLDNFYFYTSDVDANYSNEYPIIETWSYDTSNPVCVGETVRFSINDWYDPDNDNARGVFDCYGNGSYVGEDDYFWPDTISFHSTPYCTYDEIGTYNPVLILQDYYHQGEYGSNVTHTLVVTDAEICFEGGTGGGSNISRTGTAATEDWRAASSVGLADLGLLSTGSKIFFSIGCIVFINIVVLFYFVKSGIAVTIGTAVAIIWVDLMAMLMFVAFGLLPAWVLFLMFVMGAGFTVLVFFSAAKGE